ncbi:Polyisoprenoid-binding protein YceI [Saccharicrinis carchari]|uniref:Polyisoprenoid-binding protein YceI n=1 Tax=Saccharicrinis carchari TaxID=1168039 RepID=A0A521DQ95_SACCC|nr:YceI family protein [Saccharicrinis carchari]SMO73100.1 Polyisoprenoid-binding protein YceI [Saccharicrinis carchari]
MKKIKFVLAAFLILALSGVNAQSYNLDADNATIKWHGKKVTGEHDGEIQLKEGSFTVKDNRITAGTFIIDMKSITNNDIESDEYRNKLVNHLKSDDFFGVEKHPTAKLNITDSSPFSNNVAKVKGDLTIKGTTHPVEFEVTRNDNTYTTELTVDRSKYDVRYGSKSFFDNLGDKMIYDEFTLKVNIMAL